MDVTRARLSTLRLPTTAEATRWVLPIVLVGTTIVVLAVVRPTRRRAVARLARRGRATSAIARRTRLSQDAVRTLLQGKT